MKLNENLQVPIGTPQPMRQFLYDTLQRMAVKINGLAAGRLAAVDFTATAAPTTGTHAVGDFVRNSSPTEAGSSPNKYVVLGWVCVASGTPGTWVQARVLTGN